MGIYVKGTHYCLFCVICVSYFTTKALEVIIWFSEHKYIIFLAVFNLFLISSTKIAKTLKQTIKLLMFIDVEKIPAKIVVKSMNKIWVFYCCRYVLVTELTIKLFYLTF